MKIGVVFPQFEFGLDPIAMKDFVQAVEELGYSHVVVFDHVLTPRGVEEQANNNAHGLPFQEPLVFLGFLSAATQRLEFVTAIIILPQRQTVLLAKQVATLEILCRGRFRLGVGIGWNKVEYVALNQDFHTRGKRIEEQIILLRRLWSEHLVTFNGQWDRVPQAGLNPLPINGSIPIWFGGHADIVLRRMARLGDGWIPEYTTAEEALPSINKLEHYLKEAGRSRMGFGLEVKMRYGKGNPRKWAEIMQGWEKVGATHLSIDTMHSNFEGPDEHIKAVKTFAKEVGLTL